LREPTIPVACSIWRNQGLADGKRIVPEETAVSFSYNGGSYAVMMATPQNLEDFAVGFSITEGVVSAPPQIKQLEIVEHGAGIELRMWLSEPRARALSDRRRYLAGPTGCGLCGIDSLDEAVRTPKRVRDGQTFAASDIMRALELLPPRQELNRQTRAVHAAAFWHPDGGLIAVREDVGRHNAVDKLAGALLSERVSVSDGMVLLTSRVSVEMVQKSAAIGAPIIVAVSAPTALAIRTAEAAGITLVAIARGDGFEVFANAERIKQTAEKAVTHVA
jgi:FdhD protein